MDKQYLERHPATKDGLSIVIFIICVIIGTMIINSFVFRSFSVQGPSMEQTLFTGDRLIVNRLPHTFSAIQGKEWVPERNQVIVFKNPNYADGHRDEFIVKRVIAFPGERVTVNGGVLKVFNQDHPEGFEPDKLVQDQLGPGSPTSGQVDKVVPEGSIFVAGDHREGAFSLDSRNGLGAIPYFDIIGPVSMRIFPFTDLRFF